MDGLIPFFTGLAGAGLIVAAAALLAVHLILRARRYGRNRQG